MDSTRVGIDWLGEDAGRPVALRLEVTGTGRCARSDQHGAWNRPNALASSIVLVCRPRPDTAGVTDRRGFIQALKGSWGTRCVICRAGA